ncbi:TFIIEalpha/SarR/Rpc3 HTH domain [Phytophthora cactorum]|nr:TFIIEalpha/SarR/Rpc3 HTH domain [Phytophthora cactorum]
MGNAVNLQTRQVRKIMNELHQDNLVCDGRRQLVHVYWYIDYKYFVDVVQYRLYLMHEHLKDSEQLKSSDKHSNAGPRYQFRCGHCNELLLECDNNDRLLRIQNLQRKFKDQMNKQNGMHEGLYEVLRRIGDFVKEGHALPNNLPSDNRAAGIGGNSARAANGTGDDQNSQSYLYPYGAQDQEIIVDIAGNDQAEDEYLTSRERKEDKRRQTNSSISGHMAAKHLQAAAADEQPIPMETSLQGVDPLTQSEMTEEQRQEAFKRAYMAELERYNEENHEGEVQVQVDKQGWDAEMNGDAMDEEELEDVEWEWCTDDEGGVNDMEVMVNGQPKRLDGVDDEDLLNMTEEEFLSCYRMCLAENGVSQ